ncbi:hypothetical protein ACFQ4Z_02955 [Oceanobacillus oncorhynchi subsp. oncorhynchi]|uniref:hypothetical protein n=1 Tax=Oceanobacillus TaxID=182709 RepID=UPI0030DB0193
MEAFDIYTEGVQHTVVANSQKEANEYFAKLSNKKIIYSEPVAGPGIINWSLRDTSEFNNIEKQEI